MKTNVETPNELKEVADKVINAFSEMLDVQANKNADKIISCKLLQEKMGWSYSTMRRRLKEYAIPQVTMPGWKLRKGVSLYLIENALGINLELTENDMLYETPNHQKVMEVIDVISSK